jgi:hypothetical protein
MIRDAVSSSSEGVTASRGRSMKDKNIHKEVIHKAGRGKSDARQSRQEEQEYKGGPMLVYVYSYKKVRAAEDLSKICSQQHGREVEAKVHKARAGGEHHDLRKVYEVEDMFCQHCIVI